MKKVFVGIGMLALAAAPVSAQHNPCVAYSVTNCAPVPSMSLAPVNPITVSLCMPVVASTTMITNAGKVVVTSVDESCYQTMRTIATNYPSVVSNWTVVSWSGQMTTNAGLWASFMPPSAGSGTIIFYVKYTTPAPCAWTYTASRSVSVTATNCAPGIITQPTNQTVAVGDTVTFTVAACGAAPLSYQWSFNGTNIPGATASNYTKTNVQLADAGNYAVRVTNTLGAVTSSVAVLAVVTPPSIITQPASQTVSDGSNAVFTVTAVGTAPLSWQWRFNGNNVAGATASNYTIADVQAGNAGNYTVVVTNAYGSVTSSVAILTRTAQAPVFVVEPIPQTVVEGDTVTFSALAIGTEPISYQWQEYDPLSSTYTNLPGQTSRHFVDVKMQSGDAGIYAILVSNSVGTAFCTNGVLTDAGDISSTVMPVFGPRQDYTFQAYTTYYIGFSYYGYYSTNVDLYGTTTIQGGAVIKFDCDEGAPYPSLVLHGPLVCQTGPYNPAILTSIDDDSQGEFPLVWWAYYDDISSSWPVPVATGCAYLNLDDVHDTNPTSLNYLRFCYADQAVTTPTNTAGLEIWNCQFVQCNTGLNSWAPNSPTTNRLHNVLFSLCGTAFAAQTNLAELDGEQVTADVGSFWNPELPPGTVCLTNSIVLGDFGRGPVLLTQNVSINPENSPFEAGNSGNYYLARGSGCCGSGTININPQLLMALSQKTTEAPISLAGYDWITNNTDVYGDYCFYPASLGIQEMTLFPVVQRYGGGAPDLGYYYDPLDYTVAAISVTNRVTVLPGTAIGFRNDFLGGFFLQDGSAFVAQGTPTNPVVLADIEFVQEGPLQEGFVYQSYPPRWWIEWTFCFDFYLYGGIDFFCANAGTNSTSSAPALNLRFCNLYLTSDDFSLWSGSLGDLEGFGLSPATSVRWTMRDCNQHGGQIVVGQPLDATQPNFVYTPGAVGWTNNLFDTVGIELDPSFRVDENDYLSYFGATNDGTANVDLPLRAVNNLFKGGYLMLMPVASSAGDWVFHNNLFDQVLFIQDTNQPVIAEYNGYWPDVFNNDEEAWLQWAGWSPPWQVVLELVNNSGSPGSTHDQILTSAPPYQNGPFGNYYMPVGSVLAGAGSTTAGQLGLYEYTTATNEVGQANSVVDIGLHYLVASNSPSGWVPLGSNPGEIPNYVKDVNGNGVIPTGASDPASVLYTNVDLDGDGMVGLVESALNGNPLVFDNPLTLVQRVTGQEPAIVTVEAQVAYSLVQNVGQLVLMVDGNPISATPQAASDGNCLLAWDTANYTAGQTHYLQARLVLNDSGQSADGPPVAINQPIVIVQPVSQTNGLGGTATFTASTTGSGPYTYQWQFDGTNIVGATSSSLTLTNLTMADNGDYTVVVTGADGNPVTSSSAVLVVQNSPLAITVQPLSQQVVEADAVTFAVTAVGTPPLWYQWQKFDDNPGSPTYNTWLDIPGATNAAFTMLNMQSGEAGTYCVVVSNAATNLASAPAVLTDLGYSPDMTTMPVMGPRQNYTFRGDRTYLIGSPFFTEPTVDLYGSTTIEGRTVIRFYNATNASLIVHGTLSCATGPYMPAILTSVDDFSQGEIAWVPDPYGWYPLGTGTPQMASRRVAYLNLDDAQDAGGTMLSYLRFCYADQAVTTPTNSANLQVWNCQFYDCNSCVNSRLRNGYSTNGLHNVLFGLCNYALATQNPGAEAGAEQVTADVVSFWNPEFAPAKLGLTNSIVIGDFPGGPTLLTENVDINPPESPFGPSGDGNYYLSAGSPCRNAGTANINPALLSQLKSKTTWAPDAIAMGTVLSAPTILAPTVPRYSGGPPDLGYYYDALDLTVGGVLVSNQVTVLPGTAVGIRNDFIGAFFIAGGSSLISEGDPTNLITYADAQLVQEGPFVPGCAYNWSLESTNGYGGVVFFTPTFVSSSSATLTMDFSQVFLTADDSCVQAGMPPDQNSSVAISPSSSIYWAMRDSSVKGGYITIGKPVGGDVGTVYPGGSVVWANNLFQDVQVVLQPSFTPLDGNSSGPNVDMQVQAWNNLFHQGSLGLEPITNSTGNWTFTDNLFDQEAFFQDARQPLDYGYDAYYPLLAADLPGYSMYLPVLPWSLPSTLAAELSPTTTGDGTTDGLHEQTNSVGPLYQTGLLGPFYQDTSSSLLNAGSRTAAAAGLAAFTVLTNGNEEGTANVSIGLHYVAVDSYGVPYGSGGLPNWWQLAYYGTVGISPTAPDANGDGYTALEKYELGLDPNIFYSDPLIVQPPLDQQAYVGTPAAFSVTAGGTLPLSYQWYFNGIPIAGATQSSLIFNSVQLSNEGDYWVTVSSGNGATPPNQVTSPVATLSVLSDFMLFAQPNAANIGWSANFSVSSVFSVGTSYQWYFNGIAISGATNGSYLLTNVQLTNAGYYSVSVNNANPTNLVTYFGVLAGPPPPVANPDIFTVTANNSANELDVLANDVVAIDFLTITNVTQPQHGAASIQPGGQSVNYDSTINPDYVGPDCFNYSVIDGSGAASTATVTVFVSATGDSTLNASDVSVVLQTNVFTAQIDLGTNDPGSSIAVYSPGAPSLGTVTVNGSVLTYTRNPDLFGSDTFTYTIADADANWGQATITVDQTNTAGDGIPDQWKVRYGLDTTRDVSTEDPDGDGLPNLGEYALHTDPLVADNPLKLPAVQALNRISGIVQIPLPQLNPNIDANAVTFQLNVNESPSDSKVFQADGQWFAQWDTFTTPNDTYELSLQCYYNQLTADANDSVTSASSLVTVHNPITLSVGSKRYESQLNINASVNQPGKYYSIDVYDGVTQDYLTTLSGPVSANAIDTSWDLDGQPTDHPLAMVANLETYPLPLPPPTPQPKPKPQPKPIPPIPVPIPIPRDKYIESDQYVLAAGWTGVSLPYYNDLQSGMIWGCCSVLNTLFEWYPTPDYILLPSINVPYGNAFMWTSRPDTLTLYRSLLAGDNFFFVGHGNCSVISAATNGLSIGLAMKASTIAKGLGNQFPDVGYGHPYRLTILYACYTYSKPLCSAFGVNFADQTTCASYFVQGKKMRAFAGWADCSLMPSDTPGGRLQLQCVLQPAMETLHSMWMYQVPLVTCVNTYVNSLYTGGALGSPYGFTDINTNTGKAYIKSWNISGCYDLSTSYYLTQ